MAFLVAGKARVKAQRLECREQRWVGDSAQEVAGTGHGRQQGTGEGLAWTGAIWALILILPQPSCMTLGKSLGLRFFPKQEPPHMPPRAAVELSLLWARSAFETH